MAGSRFRSRAVLFLRVVTGVLLMLALFFLPAGTFHWPEAWLFIFFYLASVSGIFIWLKKKSPSLLSERMARKKEAKRWDRTLIMTYTSVLIALLIVPGLDAVRFRWSSVPLTLKGLGSPRTWSGSRKTAGIRSARRARIGTSAIRCTWESS